MGNQNWVWPHLEQEIREGCQMHISFRVLGFLEGSSVNLLDKLAPDFFNLQLVVGGWPEMGENQIQIHHLLYFQSCVKAG